MMHLCIRCIITFDIASHVEIVHHNRMRVRASISSAGRGEKPRRKGKGDHRKAPHSIRTTVTLSPESQQIVERFRSANGTSTSAAIDQIIQRSEPRPPRLKEVNGFMVLSTPPEHAEDGHYFTLEDIKRAEDEMDREYVERGLRSVRNSIAETRKTRRKR